MHLASSYYTIYTNTHQTSTQSTNTKSPSNHEENPKLKQPQQQQQQFWQEFEFTSQDKEQIQNTLQQNQYKCDILQNAVTKQRGQFIIDKYEKEAMINWDNFYSSHETKFFKDRHYLYKAFPNEFGVVYNRYNKRDDGDGGDDDDDIEGGGEWNGMDTTEYEKSCERLNYCNTKNVIDSDEIFTITEIGCGVGNTVLPLLELDKYVYEPITTPTTTATTTETNNKNKILKKKMFVWGLDFSSVAIDLLRKDERYVNATSSMNDRARAQVWDITSTHPNQISAEIIQEPNNQHQQQQQQQQDNSNNFPLLRYHLSLESSSNISLLLFVLSAISPEKMPQAALHVASTLKPGGTLVFRDYGRYDEAQIKLGTSRNKRLSDNFYVKHDGTRCYYFTVEDVQRLFGKSKGSEDGSESVGAGLDVLELKYVQRVYKNRSDDATRKRVWVQARFQKPLI